MAIDIRKYVAVVPSIFVPAILIFAQLWTALSRITRELTFPDNVHVFTGRAGLEEIADIAVQVNERTENIGARRLFTIMERLLEQISFEGPEWPDKAVNITADHVRERLKDVVKDQDLSRYIL